MKYDFGPITKMLKKFNLRKLTKWFAVVSFVLALSTSYVWFTRVHIDEEARFWMAVNNSMSTPSVVRTLEQGGSGNKVIQDYRFHYAPQRVIENKVSFSEKSSTTDTSIVTEGVITTTDQYLRYTGFRSNSGTTLDSILGEWAVQTPPDERLEESRLNYLSEQVTLAIFGNFGADYRQNVIGIMRDQNVYDGNLTAPAEEDIDGEASLVYTVEVDLRAYATLLGQAFVDAGYGEFPPLDPEGYREGSAVAAQFVVRKRDNAFVKISFGGREESYSNYGVMKNVEIPQGTIDINELQQKVEAELR